MKREEKKQTPIVVGPTVLKEIETTPGVSIYQLAFRLGLNKNDDDLWYLLTLLRSRGVASKIQSIKGLLYPLPKQSRVSSNGLALTTV